MSKKRELSPDEFRTQVRERRRVFMQAWEHVKDDCLVFQKHRSPSEDHCDQLHASLPRLLCPAQELEALFENLTSLPLGVIPYRYDLLMALHCITRLLEDLPVLLIAFRRLCSTPSYRALAHLQEIQRKLEELEQSTQSIRHSIDRMLLRAADGSTEAAADERFTKREPQRE